MIDLMELIELIEMIEMVEMENLLLLLLIESKNSQRFMLTCLHRFKRIRKEFGKNLEKALDFTNISDFAKDFIGP